MAANEGLDGCGGVHVRDRDHSLDVHNGGEVRPGCLHLVDVGHVGHRTAGTQIRKDDSLLGSGQDVSRFRHEVDSTKDDDLCVSLLRSDLRKSKRIPTGVSEVHDFIHLVVVAKDQQAAPEGFLGRCDATGEFL